MNIQAETEAVRKHVNQHKPHSLTVAFLLMPHNF